MKQLLTAGIAGQINPDRINLCMLMIYPCLSVFIGGYMNYSG